MKLAAGTMRSAAKFCVASATPDSPVPDASIALGAPLQDFHDLLQRAIAHHVVLAGYRGNSADIEDLDQVGCLYDNIAVLSERQQSGVKTLEDIVDYCALGREEVEALSEHEHVDGVAAATLADYLMNLNEGPQRVQEMICDIGKP
jgi:hypothetical protein